jgi:hypothetical protein
MKKILEIIVLSLLLTNNTNTVTLEEDWAKETNSNSSGSAGLSNAENFLLGMMGQLSEDIACGC